MPVRAVLFDVGDTLWHAAGAPPPAEFRRRAAERAAAFLRARGLPAADPAALARACWDAMEAAMRAARSGDLVEPDYPRVAADAAAALGVPLDRAAAADFLDAIYVSGAEGGKVAYPDARPTLDALRQRGFHLGIVTNRAFGGERFRADLREAGLDIDWDVIAVSVEVGYLKPHPRLFHAALDALGLAPAEAVMVGNSLAEDIAGAQRLGMPAAWKRSAADADGVVPDFTFDRVSELLDWSLLAEAARVR
ncbi:HAD family hydrolase [Tepidiforma bonchosmolovskayae]|jgi:putative hydrolase of the HAD superfamily|nr:HAD-IA family hydrolase [Tepidiforma bonchosmolovskayae]